MFVVSSNLSQQKSTTAEIFRHIFSRNIKPIDAILCKGIQGLIRDFGELRMDGWLRRGGCGSMGDLGWVGWNGSSLLGVWFVVGTA